MHRYAKSIRRLITFYSIFLQKFRKIKECFETQASNLFVPQKLREIKEYFASAAFFLISKISWNHSTQEFYSHPFFRKYFVKVTLPKIAWNQKMLWIFLLDLKLKKWIKHSNSCNFAAKRLWKHKCDVVCRKLGVGVFY